ncbi:hypothetical protein CSW64_03995 [Caulobacter mirabilis]|uniref:Fe2OG dioxygenase domain-containing protein n=1 Tax=Caulobacter mirabilis TaxID=69666 RepID=A0A2D2AUJ2_9CAUL|nr:hypothetical protein CSW64_03995 [Caulobacter mirabilis]
MGSGLDRPLRLDQGLRPEACRPIFRQFGRLHLPGVLVQEDAIALHRAIVGAEGWRRTVHVEDGRDAELSIEEIEELGPEQRAAFEKGLHDMARDSFRYVFDSIRVSALAQFDQPVDPALVAIWRFMNSETFLGFVRELTGDDRPAYCDMMATRYLPGHFLTAHDDEAPGKNRLYAYVLNLTARWRADWGGILMFLDDEDHVAEGYVPAFNALNIFKVPQRHAVSLVAPFAGDQRISLTGWIRSAPPAPGES